MKKTLIALMALAGIAAAAQYEITAADNLYAGEFDLTFTIEEGAVVSGDYDILAAYYQVNNGGAYTVNAFKLYSNGTLTLERGKSLSSDPLDNETILETTHNTSTFAADGEAYTLGAGSYTLEYLGGTNGEAAANLYLGEELVASFTEGSHNLNGAPNSNGDLTLYLTTNDSYATPLVPEPTTATLSLLALAGLAARRRRK